MLRPFDYVLSKNDLLFVVRNHEERDNHIIAMPKYAPFRITRTKFYGRTWHMIGKEWSRISDLFDPSCHLPMELLDNLSIFERCASGYILKQEDIKESFKATVGVENLFASCDYERNTIRDSAKQLIDLLSRVVSRDDLGLTGSSLFRGEIEGFSDIDIVVYGSKNYLDLSNYLRKQTSSIIHFRTISEWKGFHDHFGVRSNLSREEFARHMANKADQILINGIPVSIFAVRAFPSDFQYFDQFVKHSQNTKTKSTILGTVDDISESMFIPAIYLIKAQDTSRPIWCYTDNRAYLSQAHIGDRVEISGYLNDGDDSDWLWTESAGYIKLAESPTYPVMVARNIAYSHPFLFSETESASAIYRRRNLDLATLFDPKELKLYELNREAILIFELARKGVPDREIWQSLTKKYINIPADRIVYFINMLKSKGFL